MGSRRYGFHRAGMPAFQPEPRPKNPTDRPQIVVKRLIDYIFPTRECLKAVAYVPQADARSSSEAAAAGLEWGP